MKLNAMITNYSDVMDKLKIEWGEEIFDDDVQMPLVVIDLTLLVWIT